MNILEVLKAFEALNTRKARFARNRLLHGSMSFQKPASPSIFRCVLNNQIKYELSPVLFNGKNIACSFSSESPDFRTAKYVATDDDAFSYTVVIYFEENDTNQTLYERRDGFDLKYFLLVVDRSNVFPVEKADETLARMAVDPMREYIAGGYYLHDIKKNAEKRISQFMEEAGKHFGRDSIWDQLTSNSISLTEEDTVLDWTGIFLERFRANSRALGAIDSELTCMFSNLELPWPELFSLLGRVYPVSIRILPLTYASGLASKHIILVNPRNSDYAIHFGLVFAFAGESMEDEVLNPQIVDVEASAISREGLPDSCEYDHITDVINTLLYLLWDK